MLPLRKRAKSDPFQIRDLTCMTMKRCIF